MKEPEFNEEDLERKLRTFFRQEVEGLAPSQEWWNAALARLGEQDRPKRWLRLPAFPPLSPLPVAAAGLVLALALSAVAVLLAGPGTGLEGVRLAGQQAAPGELAPVPSPSPSPAPRSAAISVGDWMADGQGRVWGLVTEGMVEERSAAGIGEESAAADSAAPDHAPFLLFRATAAACPERDTAAALGDSDFALQGRVEQATPGEGSTRLLVRVERWYRGGDSGFVTISVGPPDQTLFFEPGSRWLIGGQRDADGAARSGGCGLLQGYTEERAQEWEEVLGIE